MRIYLDDLRPTPEGYTRVYTVEEGIDLILDCIKNGIKIQEISFDNDLGEGLLEGRKLLDWVEEQLYYGNMELPEVLTVHTANPAAAQYMRFSIGILREKYGNR